MDEDEQSRIERGAGGLEKDDKNVRETLFVCFRVFGGIGGCCCFAPAALLCYWGAIFIMAAQREIGVAESIKVTSYIWLTGYASGAIYSVFWCAASFYYQIEYKQVKVRGGGVRPRQNTKKLANSANCKSQVPNPHACGCGGKMKHETRSPQCHLYVDVYCPAP